MWIFFLVILLRRHARCRLENADKPIEAPCENEGRVRVSARAIWQGTLIVQKREIAVKFYSAVEDRQTHFHLLHKRDRTRVEQRMVDAETGEPIPLETARKAYQAEPGLYVVVTPEEIDRSAPRPRREVTINRCVPVSAMSPNYLTALIISDQAQRPRPTTLH